MRKIIFESIRTALTAIPEIKMVELWNNQLAYAEEEQPFNTPAVFIEFGTISWNQLPLGAREATIDVMLHVVTDSRVSSWSDVIDTFDLIDKIHSSLHGLHELAEDGSVMDTLTCSRSITDHDFDELQDNVEVYQCHVTKKSLNKLHVISGASVKPEVQVSIL